MQASCRVSQHEELALPGKRVVHHLVAPHELSLSRHLDLGAHMQHALATIQCTSDLPAGASQELPQLAGCLADLALGEDVVLRFHEPDGADDVAHRSGQTLVDVRLPQRCARDVPNLIEVSRRFVTSVSSLVCHLRCWRSRAM